jgi:hypothetical protein
MALCVLVVDVTVIPSASGSAPLNLILVYTLITIARIIKVVQDTLVADFFSWWKLDFWAVDLALE